jgi:hypothetical protein
MGALDRLNKFACWDYRLLSFDGSRLIIVGSTDLSYYHLVEAEFAEVSFLSCPTEFSHGRFRLATEAEHTLVNRLVAIDGEDILFAIDAESSGSMETQVFFILAQTLNVIEGTVYYYERENLKPGERIAPWVSKGPRPSCT